MDRSSAMYNLALMLEQEKPQEAIELYTKAAERGLPNALLKLSLFAETAKNLILAESLMQEAIKLNPEWHFILKEFYARNGQPPYSQ